MLKLLSILGYLGMAGGVIGLLALRAVYSPSPFVIGPQVAAIGLMIWARITFGRRSFHAAANATVGGLVTSGPYRYIRHPIYTAVCGFVTASVLGHPSWPAGVCGGIVLAGALLRIHCEEILVTAQYPEYREYAARTRRMIPYVF